MDKNIVSAIRAEQEYLTLNDSEVSLLSMVTPYGYDNLDDYFHDKIKYYLLLENISILYDIMEPTIDKLIDNFNNGIASAFSVRENYNRIWIWAGKDNMYLNMEPVYKNDYGVRNFNYNGGPILTCNNDFNLALIVPKSIDLDVSMVVKVVQDFLASRGYETTEDNNDLLLDGKKVLGSIVCTNDSVKLIAFELSLTDLTDLVKQVSLKASTKEPGYIKGIHRTELEEVFDKWLHSI